MTIQEPMFPPPRVRPELSAGALAAKPGARAGAKSKKRTTAQRPKPAADLPRIRGLYYPTGITPEDFFKALGKLRKKAELEVQRLIDFLDRSDRYNADDEPLLGAAELINQERAWRRGAGFEDEGEDIEGDELDQFEACDLEISGESDSPQGQGTVDDEPSLGSLDGRISQLRWGQPDRGLWWPHQDFELDEAEQEIGIEDLPHDAEYVAGGEWTS